MTKTGRQDIRENEQGTRIRYLPCSDHVTFTTNEGKGRGGGEDATQRAKNQMGIEIKPILYLIEQTFLQLNSQQPSKASR